MREIRSIRFPVNVPGCGHSMQALVRAIMRAEVRKVRRGEYIID